MIEKLENNEQVLLMYLAGELPAEDRADVERMLAADPGLRRNWQELQSLHTSVFDQLGQLDETLATPVSTEFAVRQVGRAMRQKIAQPKVAPVRAASEEQSRSWWWLYPAVVAASVAIIAMVWIGHQQTPTRLAPSPVPGVMPDTPDSLADSQNANESDDELLIDSLEPPTATDHPEARPADEESRQQVATGDVMPQDEVSRYLLNATASE